MQWLGNPSAVTSAATRTMIRIASERPSRRWRYGVPVTVVTATFGAAVLVPALAMDGVFDLLLVPVLAVALWLGLRPALATLALWGTVLALALPPVALPWVSDPAHLAALGPHAAQGVMMALIGAVVRAAIRAAHGGDHDDSDASHRSAPARPRPPVGPLLAERLTPRETEVLRVATRGQSIGELAEELYLSPNTVKTHLAHCYDKLGARNRVEAIALAVHSGSLDAADLERAAELSLADDVTGRIGATNAPARLAPRGTAVRPTELRDLGHWRRFRHPTTMAP